MKFFLSLFKKGAVVKPVMTYEDEKDSEGWLCMWATPLEDLIDDAWRYGIGAALFNFRRLKKWSK